METIVDNRRRQLTAWKEIEEESQLPVSCKEPELLLFNGHSPVA